MNRSAIRSVLMLAAGAALAFTLAACGLKGPLDPPPAAAPPPQAQLDGQPPPPPPPPESDVPASPRKRFFLDFLLD